MLIYNPRKNRVMLAGQTFYADERGIAEVPDDLVNSGLWTQGWVEASGRLRALAADEAKAAATNKPEQQPAVIAPVEPVNALQPVLVPSAVEVAVVEAAANDPNQADKPKKAKSNG